MKEEQKITTKIWLSISPNTRIKIRQKFNIYQSVSTEVQTVGGVSTVISDGITERDLEVLSVETLKDFTKDGSNDITKLLAKTIEIIEAEVPEVKPTPVEISPEVVDIMPGLRVPKVADPLPGLKKSRNVKAKK